MLRGVWHTILLVAPKAKKRVLVAAEGRAVLFEAFALIIEYSFRAFRGELSLFAWFAYFAVTALAALRSL